MALDKQIIDISFAQGIDTNTDPKVMSGRFTMIQNGVLRRDGELAKRYGSTTIKSDAGMAAGEALSTFGPELLQKAGNKLFSYSQGQSRWSDRGTCYSVAVASRQITRKTTAQIQADSVIAYGMEVHAWQEAGVGSEVRYSLIDANTGAYVVNDQLVSNGTPSGKNVRCCAMGGWLYIFFTFGTQLIVRRINPASSDGTIFSVATDLTTAGLYDVVAYSDSRFYIAYARSSDVRVIARDGVIATTPLPDVTIAETATRVTLALIETRTGQPIRIGVVYFVAGTGTRLIQYDISLVLSLPAQTIDTDTGSVQNIAINGFEIVWTVFIEKTNAATHRHLIRKVVVGTGGVISIPAAVWLRGVGLASKPFFAPDRSSLMVAVVHDSTLQSTFFVVGNDGIVVSKHQPGTAGGIVAANQLPTVSVTGSVASWSIINKTQLQSRDGNLFSLTGVSMTSIDTSDANAFAAVEIGNNLHIVGGILSMYDGVSVVEHGFHLFPENLTHTTSTGSIPAGTYLYCAVYEWTDAKGQLHRSSPSIPLSVTLGASSNVTVTIPTLRLTEKKGNRSPVSIALYRTASGQTGVFYRVSSIATPTYNDPGADTVFVVDSTPDASIFANEILYTSGGVLENMPAPAARFIAVWQNRIFLAGLEDPTSYAYSKVWSAGTPVEFAGEFTGNLDAEGGLLSGIAVLEDKLAFLKRDRIYITYGEGPNDLGLGGFFPRPQIIASDTGCTDQQSLSRVPGGVAFKSAKGFMLLSSNLQLSPVGDQVRDYVSRNVTATVLTPDDDQVRFLHSDGPCLTWDYKRNQWSVFENYDANDGLIWQNRFVFLRTTGECAVEDKSLFRDSGKAIRFKAETGWMNLAGIAGYQRVYRVSLVGEWASPHTLRVKVAYDYEDAYTTDIIFDPAWSLDPTSYGSGEFYGSISPYGGAGRAYVFEAHLNRQKCQAVRFLIEDTTPSSGEGTGEGLKLTSMSIQVGVKRGFGKKVFTKYFAATGG